MGDLKSTDLQDHSKQYIKQGDEGEQWDSTIITQRIREREQMETDESELPFVITQSDTITSWRTTPTQRCIQMFWLPLKSDLYVQRADDFTPFYSLNVILLQWWAKGPLSILRRKAGLTFFLKFPPFIFHTVPSLTDGRLFRPATTLALRSSGKHFRPQAWYSAYDTLHQLLCFKHRGTLRM